MTPRAASIASIPEGGERDPSHGILTTMSVDVSPARQDHGLRREASDVVEEEDQIAERLAWTPRQRLQYLLDMLAFEDRAHRARPIAREE